MKTLYKYGEAIKYGTCLYSDGGRPRFLTTSDIISIRDEVLSYGIDPRELSVEEFHLVAMRHKAIQSETFRKGVDGVRKSSRLMELKNERV